MSRLNLFDLIENQVKSRIMFSFYVKLQKYFTFSLL